MSWEQLSSAVSASVVRMQVAGCDGEATWTGSGFVVGPNEVMTAAHVVGDASTITVSSNLGLTRARVIDFDFSTDSALVRTELSVPGPLAISTRELSQGRELAVLGYPLGERNVQLSEGVVSGLDEQVTYDGEDGFTVDHVFVTNADTNGGNSGGPVFDRTGQVVGLVSGGQNWDSSAESRRPVQGRNYVVPANSLSDNLTEWSGQAPEAGELCNGREDPADDPHLAVTVSSDDPNAQDIAQALFTHGESINSGDYEAAWSVFSPSFQRNHPLLSWQQGLETSYWETLEVVDVTETDGGANVDVAFRTVQDTEFGHNGQTCSDWNRTYTMLLIDGVWRIDSSQGESPTAC